MEQCEYTSIFSVSGLFSYSNALLSSCYMHILLRPHSKVMHWKNNWKGWGLRFGAPCLFLPGALKITNSTHDGDDGGVELLLSLERSLPLRIRLETCCSLRCLSCSFSCWFCCCCCSRRRSFSASSCCCFMAWSSCWSWETRRAQVSMKGAHW